MSYFAPYIDGTGLHMPTYEDRLSDLVSAYRSIFGIDAEMSEAVPDYQLLSVFAKALDDTSALVLQAYNSRNPLYASGNALDLLLPMYGLSRQTGEDDAAAGVPARPLGCRPFSAENEHTGSFSGRDEPARDRARPLRPE